MCPCLAGLCCCFVFLSSNSFRLSLLRSFVNKNFELFFRFLFELRPAGFLPALLHSYASSESPLSEFLISDESYSIIGVFELQAEFSFLYKKISHLYPWYISTISYTRILGILPKLNEANTFEEDTPRYTEPQSLPESPAPFRKPCLPPQESEAPQGNGST